MEENHPKYYPACELLSRVRWLTKLSAIAILVFREFIIIFTHMRAHKLLRLPLVAVALLLIGAGCSQAKVDQNSTGPKETAVEKPASLAVSNQTVIEGAVNIPSITLPDGGWVTVHADNSGVPGAILGQTLVPAGTQTDVKVTLEMTKITPILHAMLHVDAGTKGKFEFPGGPDEPVSYLGTGITGSFQATVTGTSKQ